MTHQRRLRQQLEDLQRAGVTHVSRDFADVVKQIVAGAAGRHRTASPTTPAQSSTAGRAASVSPPVVTQPDRSASAPKSAPVATSPARSASDAAASPQPAAPAQSLHANAVMPQEYSSSMSPARPCSALSRDERIAQLKEVSSRVATCVKCQELAGTRTQTVFGVGNPEAKIMFIGEAPGADEDKQGEPFVGKAGQLLNKIIEASKLTREEIYICNILRCRPPGNRTPSPEEADNCREFLEAQIELVNPEYIVCWGACAAHNLLGTKSALGKLRGQFFDYKGIKVLVTYHPSYLLRSPGMKKEVWIDMKFFRKDMGVVLE